MVRQFLYRWTAFSFFAWAAFAWPSPFLDRAGLAALGFGFLALSLGRAWGVARPGIQAAPPFPFGLPVAVPDSLNDDLRDRLGAYADAEPD